MRAVISTSLIFTAPLVVAQSPGILALGSPNGGVARAVSANGNVVVGGTTDASVGNVGRAFSWTASGGLVSLSTQPLQRDFYTGLQDNQFNTTATAASADGSVIVGYARATNVLGSMRAFRWTPAGGMTDIGAAGEALGVNRDGSVVVGWMTSGAPSCSVNCAFRWTQGTGPVSLGTLNGGAWSEATGVSYDGSVIVGSSLDGAQGNQGRAFRWTQADGMVSLGVLGNAEVSSATAVSGNGQIVVGSSFVLSSPGPSFQAFRWTQADGMVSLGALGGGNSRAYATNFDGGVVVGYSVANIGPAPVGGVAPYVVHAFRWTQATGMQSVEDWLRANGVKVPGDTTAFAYGVSADGNTVVGQLANQTAFVARVGGFGSGIAAFPDISASISNSAESTVQAIGLVTTLLNGAYSHPLEHRAQQGKSCIWAAGDLGHDGHNSTDGRLGLGEVGGCHALTSHLQGSLAIGTSYSRQDLSLGGQSAVHATYGVAELLFNLPGTTLWASSTALHQNGTLDVRRGYLNAGVPDFSSGNPAMEANAWRLRLDWENAAQLGKVALTPYADIADVRTTVAAYTESGGGFPASFNARVAKSTEVHLGLDATYAITSNTRLLGRMEAAHESHPEGASTSGTVLGLFEFDIPAQHVSSNWLRGGMGADTRVGPGTLTAMLNATTGGPGPNYWLNMSYKVDF